MIKKRSHAMSHVLWVYHWYPVAAVALPTVQGIT